MIRTRKFTLRFSTEELKMLQVLSKYRGMDASGLIRSIIYEDARGFKDCSRQVGSAFRRAIEWKSQAHVR